MQEPPQGRGTDHRADARGESKNDGPRINNEIRSPQVRLIGEDGEMLGVISTRQAISAAEEAGLDLVEVSPNAEPPVCKILDYGKFKYEQQKKKAEAKKKQKVIELKEIKLRPNIDDNDYEIKLRNARRFLEEGDKVKFTLRFRGREMMHQELGMNLLMRIKDTLEAIAKVEQSPQLEGKQMVMILVSAK
ncbi:MAG: translation initiation factor IF-3 [Alphaproteobacteria bacterium]